MSAQRSLFRRWWSVSINHHFSGGSEPMGTSNTLAKFRNKADAEKYLAEQKVLRGY